MDILTTPITLIIIANIFMLTVFMGMLNSAREKQLIKFLNATGRAILDIIKAIAKLFAGIIGLFAESAKNTEFDEVSDNSVSGGSFNYRTGKFDDGTDPVGWYEGD